MKSKNGTVLKTIKSNNEFKEIITHNKSSRSNSFQIWITTNKDLITTYGVTISKKNYKRAVDRNKIKRQIKNMLNNIVIKQNLRIIIKPSSLFMQKEFSQNLLELEKLINQR